MSEDKDLAPSAQLPAGRELDALVAERVMGFWFADDSWWGPHPRMKGERAHASCCGGTIWGPNIGHDGLPRFSTSIEAAWLVVEKMASLRLLLRLEQSLQPKLFWAVFANPSAELPPGSGVEEDGAALSICLAALKACAALESP